MTCIHVIGHQRIRRKQLRKLQTIPQLQTLRPQIPALALPRVAASRAHAMASRAALAQGFQEHQVRACASSSFSLSDRPEMASRLMRAPSRARARAISHHHEPVPRRALGHGASGHHACASKTVHFARARARCGGAAHSNAFIVSRPSERARTICGQV